MQRHDATVLRKLREELQLSHEVLARLIACSQEQIEEWETGKPLPTETRQRIKDILGIKSELEKLMQRDFIAEWLEKPNESLDGQTPLEILERGEFDRIRDWIHDTVFGGPI